MRVSPWVGPVAVRDSLVGVLAEGFPVLLTGPGGVGKYKLALEVAARLGSPVEVASGVAGITEMVRTISVRSQKKKIVVLSLDSHSHPLVLNRLLKVLEEPRDVGFVLTCSHRPLGTVASRCVSVQVPSLPAQQVAAVLLSLSDDELGRAGVVGLTQDLAWWAGRAAGGSVGVGLSLVAAAPFLGRAGAFLRAIAESDRAAGLATLAGMGADPAESAAVGLLLSVWASEVARYGGSDLLGDTFGAERRGLLVTFLAGLASQNPVLALRMIFEREVLVS